MVLAGMVLVTISLSSIWVVTLRQQQINARLNTLTEEAREIAYLAARNDASTMAWMMGADMDTQFLISWKSERVYQDYNAYIVVVDRRGRVMDNMATAIHDDPDFASSLNGRELRDLLIEVMGGGEVSLRTSIGGAPTFTVGVPFVRNGTVLGAVLIHTGAQTVEGGINEVILPVVLVATLITMILGLAMFIFIRRIMKPMHALTDASRAMSEGDFSARVNAEMGTAEIKEMAAAFNLMAEKVSAQDLSRREFVANVSHELRSPITSIAGFVQGILDGTIPPEEHMKYLGVVGQETGRLNRLIESLLALSRLEREDAGLNLTRFDMCELLRRCVIRRVNDLEEKHMDVECDFREDPCRVLADMDRMEQVAVNLLDNAVKFTPEGGRITLITRRAGNRAEIVVMDNGIGIAPEDRGRIFERFFTVDRAHTSGRGTGLGLSICQRILQMHGESIRLLDTDEGAAFAFTLKLDTEVREMTDGRDREDQGKD